MIGIHASHGRSRRVAVEEFGFASKGPKHANSSGTLQNKSMVPSFEATTSLVATTTQKPLEREPAEEQKLPTGCDRSILSISEGGFSSSDTPQPLPTERTSTRDTVEEEKYPPSSRVSVMWLDQSICDPFNACAPLNKAEVRHLHHC